MIKKFITHSLMLSSAVVSLQIHALEIVGITTSSTLSSQSRPGLRATKETPVSLMHVKLSKQEVAVLKNPQLSYKTYKNKNLAFSKLPLPSKAELNFSALPILDQGMHGACVTFATVGAFNYLIDKPDHVSALCSLALGSTLANNGYYWSGWDGSYGPFVLDQFMRFGYVTKTDQTKYGCAGLKDYPLDNESDTGNPMSLNAYKEHSHSLVSDPVSANKINKIYWTPILSVEERFNLDGDDNYDSEKVLTAVKKAIVNNVNETKSIVTFGTLLYGDLCHAGACAKHNVQDDTWALTDNITSRLQNNIGPDAGHEIIIIGYDDNATSVDRDGKIHTGLLTIRNSWGATAGDKGNYYMTYDYFKAFVDEVQKISKVVLTNE